MDSMYVKKSQIFDLNTPQTIVPIPTDADYDNGFIIRFFIRKANDVNGFIFEVDKDVYEKYIENPYWIAADMRWRISGPLNMTYKKNDYIDDFGVLESNKKSILYVSKIIKNIGLYLPNLLQFYK
ncbi:MAG: hypothetical protein FJ187_08795 [Gammaproteobacteria bacterium]|nr:hypothetical protein [Gammaproteobacteria bacterium]